MLNAKVFKMLSSVRWAFNWKEWEPSKQEFEHAISCIQSEEKTRLERFVYRKDVKASLIGRLLMRKFVNEYIGLPYDKIIFVRNERNKPLLMDSSIVINFNVSHQGSYTVLAGEIKDIKLGVDVMEFDYMKNTRISEFFHTMRRNFSTAEWEEIKASGKSEKEQLCMFYRHWALKESYVKALGLGIHADLKSLDFRTNSELSRSSVTTDSVLYINGIKENWLFEESLLDQQHCVAVALQKNEKLSQLNNTTFEIIDYDKLMAHAIPLFPIDPQYAIKYFAKSEKPWLY